MPSNPKSIGEKLNNLIHAWETLAPAKSFAGTLAEFKTGVGPSITSRATIAMLEAQLTEAINQRDDADKTSMVLYQRAINGILADPTEGPDSSLLEATGRVRQSERKSGLHRANKGGAAPSTGGTPPPAP